MHKKPHTEETTLKQPKKHEGAKNFGTRRMELLFVRIVTLKQTIIKNVHQ